ncbi:MAG: hypothetical protein U9M94_03435 [Patescibacteria group bacterium]|nr:hypothetical protein [Patescibacteria group bacterium]
MSGNNFVTNQENVKKAGQEEKGKIAWTSPDSGLADNQPLEKNKKGFFSFFKKSQNNTVDNNSDFAAKKRFLNEYNEALKAEKQDKDFSVKKNIKSAAKSLNQKKPGKRGLSLESLKSGINKIDNSGFPSKITLKTNLIKEDVTTYVNWKKNIILLLFGLVFVVLGIGGFYARLIYKEYASGLEGKDLDNEIKVLNVKINNLEDQNQEIIEFQKKLDIAAGLLDNHIYWTNFFKFLEENTLSNTYYTSSVSGDIAGIFNFEVVAKNYSGIDNQLRILRANKHVLKASILSGSMNEEGEEDKKIKSGVKYSLELELSPDIFKIKQND